MELLHVTLVVGQCLVHQGVLFGPGQHVLDRQTLVLRCLVEFHVITVDAMSLLVDQVSEVVYGHIFILNQIAFDFALYETEDL